VENRRSDTESKQCNKMKNETTINHQQMPALNEQFGASGGVARPTVCTDYQAIAPVRVVVETSACRQAASTLAATRADSTA